MNRCLDVRVLIDESGRDDEPVRADDLAARRRHKAVAIHSNDAVAPDRDVSAKSGGAGAVDDGAAEDHDVIGRRGLLCAGRNYHLTDSADQQGSLHGWTILSSRPAASYCYRRVLPVVVVLPALTSPRHIDDGSHGAQ
jgi:hypothetical protein